MWTNRLADLPRIHFCHANFFWILFFWFPSLLSYVQKSSLSPFSRYFFFFNVKMRIGARTHRQWNKQARKNWTHIMALSVHTHAERKRQSIATQSHMYSRAHTNCDSHLVWNRTLFLKCGRCDLHRYTSIEKKKIWMKSGLVFINSGSSTLLLYCFIHYSENSFSHIDVWRPAHDPSPMPIACPFRSLLYISTQKMCEKHFNQTQSACSQKYCRRISPVHEKAMQIRMYHRNATEWRIKVNIKHLAVYLYHLPHVPQNYCIALSTHHLH